MISLLIILIMRNIVPLCRVYSLYMCAGSVLAAQHECTRVCVPAWCACVHVSPCASEMVVEWVRVRVRVRAREITIVGWGFKVTQ